jgi:hypothetical protein
MILCIFLEVAFQEKECDPHCLQAKEHERRARAKRKQGASKHAQNVAKRALVKGGRSPKQHGQGNILKTFQKSWHILRKKVMKFSSRIA